MTEAENLPLPNRASNPIPGEDARSLHRDSSIEAAGEQRDVSLLKEPGEGSNSRKSAEQNTFRKDEFDGHDTGAGRSVEQGTPSSVEDTESVYDNDLARSGMRAEAVTDAVLLAGSSSPSSAAEPNFPKLAVHDSSALLPSPFDLSENINTLPGASTVLDEHITPRTTESASLRDMQESKSISSEETCIRLSLPSTNSLEQPTVSAVTSSSPPASPSDILRPLTPPFPDDIEPPHITEPPLPPAHTNPDAGILTAPYILSDGRRHSSAALSPTGEADGLLAPIPFPEQRRYSLVDPGPIVGLGAGRRTLSDVGQIPFTPPPRRPRRALRDAVDTDSASSSRSPSRPSSTARFSTFAEMGIQSFAMAKGEKVVDTVKKEKKGKDRANGKLEKKKRKSVVPGELINDTQGEKSTSFDFESGSDTQKEAAHSDAITNKAGTTEAQSEPKLAERQRNSKAKFADCIIM